jgi:phosphoribosylaminoimidazole-succinocarboxamide synthase
VRDWLDESGWDHTPPGPPLPDEVVEKTTERYMEACRHLTGETP